VSGGFSIGEIARLTGVPAKTIRYYEEIDLMPAPERAANGYRRYGDRAVQLLRFVKRARDLGFSIEEVAELLTLWEDKARASSEVRVIAANHIDRVDQKISELQSLRRTLQNLVDRCHGDHRPDCPILDDLADGPRS